MLPARCSRRIRQAGSNGRSASAGDSGAYDYTRCVRCAIWALDKDDAGACIETAGAGAGNRRGLYARAGVVGLVLGAALSLQLGG